MQQYLELLKNIKDNGRNHATDRTGHGRRRLFSQTVKFDLRDNKLPVVTTRAINPLHGIREALFFIAGDTNIKNLSEQGTKIWDPWAVTEGTFETIREKLLATKALTPEQALTIQGVDEELIGSIGPMYGEVWRNAPMTAKGVPLTAMNRTIDTIPSDTVENIKHYMETSEEAESFANASEEQRNNFIVMSYFSAIDQLGELVYNLKNDPYSSRHLVTAFLPEYTPISGYTPDENVLLGRGSLMPCHHSFQVFVNPPIEEGGKPELSLQVNFRSWDVPLGGPTNIVCYSFIAHALAHCLDMQAVELSIVAGDAHIYFDQLEGVEEQITRAPYDPPKIIFNEENKDFFNLNLSDIVISEFVQHEAIKYPAAV